MSQQWFFLSRIRIVTTSLKSFSAFIDITDDLYFKMKAIELTGMTPKSKTRNKNG